MASSKGDSAAIFQGKETGPSLHLFPALLCFSSFSPPRSAEELHSKSDEANEDLEVPRNSRVRTRCTAPSSSAPSPWRCNPTGMSASAQQDLPDPGVRGHSDGKEGGTAHKKSPATVPLPQRTVIPCYVLDTSIRKHAVGSLLPAPFSPRSASPKPKGCRAMPTHCYPGRFTLPRSSNV